MEPHEQDTIRIITKTYDYGLVAYEIAHLFTKSKI